jgi:transposase
MPNGYASQFRAMVVEQVRAGRRVVDVAASVEVPPSTVFRWVRQDRIDRGERWLAPRRWRTRSCGRRVVGSSRHPTVIRRAARRGTAVLARASSRPRVKEMRRASHCVGPTRNSASYAPSTASTIDSTASKGPPSAPSMWYRSATNVGEL